MDRIEYWLRKSPQAICLLVACLFTWIISVNGFIASDVVPFNDGYHYAIRAFTLYGYLHSGQWSAFYNAFTLPTRDDLAPLHYWLFFLLPTGWAGITAYGLILVLTTYFLLAVGIYGICSVLERKEWVVPLYLICLFQNVSLDYSFFYFCDAPFYAATSLVLAAQLRAWKNETWSAGFLSGAVLGSLFWIKPANAALYALTFSVAEVVWIGISLVLALRRGVALKRAVQLFRHLVSLVLGFLPVTGMAMILGSAQVMLMLLYANEIGSGFTTYLTCAGLVRLFYFPLCLSYFYNVSLLALLAAGMAVFSYLSRGSTRPASHQTDRAVPMQLLLPILAGALFLGEYFSFGLETKTMRALLPILPPLWLFIFWISERVGVRLGTLTLGLAAYALCATDQVLFNGFENVSRVPESYQIEGDWYERFPSPNYLVVGVADITRKLVDQIHLALPAGGKVAVSTSMFYVNDYSLSWFDSRAALLKGQKPIYEYTRLVDGIGAFERSALVGDNAIVLLTYPGYQSSDAGARQTWKTVAYSKLKWEHDKVASIIPLQESPEGPPQEVGFIVVFKEPLSDAQVDLWTRIVKMPETPVSTDPMSRYFEHKLTLGESWNVVARWWRHDEVNKNNPTDSLSGLPDLSGNTGLNRAPSS